MMRALFLLLTLALAGLLGACATTTQDWECKACTEASTGSNRAVLDTLRPPELSAPASQTPAVPPSVDLSLPLDLWDRLVRGFAIPTLDPTTPAGRHQAQHVAWYRQRPEHLRRVFTRARLYLHDIVQATEAAGLPLEVALLPAVESAFQPHAVSSAAADGLWQFIAPTGRRYELKRHLFLDERRNPRAATRAALRYLSDLRIRYGGDISLALAAYNCGEGCIDRALRRAKAEGWGGAFADLRLNPETAQYVPRLLALAQVVKEAVRTPTPVRDDIMVAIGLPPLADIPYFGTVELDRDIDLSLAARLAGLPLEEFLALNPQHRKPLIAAAAQQEILLPIDRVPLFERALRQHRGPLASWSVFRVQRTKPARQLARELGWNIDSMLAVNDIGTTNRLIKAQSTLLVPRPPHRSDVDIAEHVLESSWIVTAPLPAPRSMAGRSSKPKRTQLAKTKTSSASRIHTH